MTSVVLPEVPKVLTTDRAHAINASLWVKYSVTGKLDLTTDEKAVRAYFHNEINTNHRSFLNLKERLSFMTSEQYYTKELFEMYSWEFLLKIYDAAYAYKYRFKKYISAHTFYERMAIRDRVTKQYLERIEDRTVVTALHLAQGNEEDAIRYTDVIMQGIYQPATPTFQNSGRKTGGGLVSCFILDTDDDLTHIFRTTGNAAELSKIGGGVGICGTNIRAAKSAIRGIPGLCRGTMPYAKHLEDTASWIDQLGIRPGAFLFSINALHRDMPILLDAKKAVENRDPRSELKTLHLCVVIPDILKKKSAANEKIAQFCPADILAVTGKRWTEILIDDYYDQLVADDRVEKTWVNARDLEDDISFTQSESGEPFVMFEGTVNRSNALKGIISATNICTEILQISTMAALNRDGSYADVGRAISCVVGSLSVHAFLHSREFVKGVHAAVDMLTSTCLLSNVDQVPPVAEANRKMRSIGLGVMDHTGFMISEDIVFGDSNSVEFTDMLMRTIRYWALVRSNELAVERNSSFEGFADSKYATGEALKHYTTETLSYSDKIKQIIETYQIPVPTQEMWEDLIRKIISGGLYHSYLMAIAPTGNISYVRGVTPSLGPAPTKIEVRENDLGLTCYPAAHLTEKNIDYYPTAHGIHYKPFIDVYAAAAPHVDQGISMTLYSPEGATTRWYNASRTYAYIKGCKTIYYIRPDDSNERPDASGSAFSKAMECESCNV